MFDPKIENLDISNILIQMDPFEAHAQKDQLKEKKETENCIAVADRICNKIKDSTSDLHKFIDNKLGENKGPFDISPKDLPELSKDFEILKKCWNRADRDPKKSKEYELKERLNNASRHITVRNAFECDEFTCHSISGLSVTTKY